MKLWVLVPVQPLGKGKSRLSAVLSVEERAELSRRILVRELGVIQDAQIAERTLVVSRDPLVLAEAEQMGVTALREQRPGLNHALRQARRAAVTGFAQAVLVLPADLPLLTAADLQRMAAQAVAGAPVTIAPSHDGGTNALLLSPPDIIDFAFGVESFARHLELARQAGVAPQIVHSPTLALDIDWPMDLARLKQVHAHQLAANPTPQHHKPDGNHRRDSAPDLCAGGAPTAGFGHDE